MNDFFELFYEFDKKFIRLIGHLISKPKVVLKDIQLHTTEYTAPFTKFDGETGEMIENRILDEYQSLFYLINALYLRLNDLKFHNNPPG